MIEPNLLPPRPERSLSLAVVGAALVTLGLLAVALYLGAWAFELRRFTMHEHRLERLLAQKPDLARVGEALTGEGMTLAGAPQTPSEREDLTERWGGHRRSEVLAKASRWPQLRVFANDDVVYFLYFDGEGKMVDFVQLARPRPGR